MAHELTMDGNVAEMAYVGDACWHGLGQKLEENASIEQWKASAGMEWEINRAPVQFALPPQMVFDEAGKPTMQDQFGVINDKHVLHRSDNNRPLGIVGSNYKIVQPGEVLEFFRDLVAGNGFSLHTAGTLFGGKRFWALASIGENAYIGGKQDEIGGYLLLSTSCDGTLATTARRTTVRVVCNNTLSMAFGETKGNSGIVSISHKSVFNPMAMKKQLGLVSESFEQFINAANSLANVHVDNMKARQFLESLMFDPKKDVEEQSTQAHNKVSAMLALFNGSGMGAKMDSANGTAWGLVNAVTEYTDHHAPTRGDFKNDKRFDSALFGEGDSLKTEALNKALELV